MPYNLTMLDLVKRFFPNSTDEECDFLLWEKTCFPGGSILQIARQLNKLSKQDQTIDLCAQRRVKSA